MRVRLALHAGEVLRDSYGVAGTAVNVAFRLLEAAPLKQALASSRGVLAVIASPWFFDDVITNTPGSEPASYRQVRVRVKETETAAWICRPDDPYPSTDDAELPPAHAAESWQLLPALSGLTAAREGRLAASVQGLGQAAPVGEAVPGQPVRLAPRPLFLAGRDGLLAELDARLAARPGRAGPQLVVLPGLGGAGKTSVAVEYAHRHLAEAGVCWQFAAEDPAVLAAEFAVLAAQLGVREPTDARDPVASVHTMLARATARWLVVFDNVPDPAE